MSEYLEDQTLNCKDCQQPFVFSGGEQKFFAAQGFNPPVRCKGCRENRKQQRPNGSSAASRPAPAPTGGYGDPSPPKNRPVVYDNPSKGNGGGRRPKGSGRKNREYDNWDD